MSLRIPQNEYKVLCKQVLDRDHWRCRHCGYRQGMSVHHVIFRSDGGRDESWNLITLCNECHDQVHSYKLYIECAPGNPVGPGGGADGEIIFTKPTKEDTWQY